MNRRHFLMSTAVMAGSAAMKGLAQSPNERVRIAVIGLGGRGGSHVNAWSRMANVEIAGICDVDESHIGEKFKLLETRGAKAPTTFVDFRKILDDKTIDAVSIATPNHWHTLHDRLACQAGKDVYVEKPCSHNVFESQQIVAAARKYDRIVQHGTQSRSSPALREAVQQLHDGEFGEVYMARGLCYKWRDTIGKTPVEPVPPGVDYDLWTGPAPKRPFTKNRFHYNWHWFWDTGNGDLGNQGIHEMDKCRWGLGVTHPTKVSAIGGKFMFDDDQETPNTISASYEFDVDGKKKMMTFEVRHWISPHEAGIQEGSRATPSGTSSTARRATWSSTTTTSITRSWARTRRRDRPQRRRTPTGRTSSTRSAAAGGRISTPKSRRARSRATWCTWRTSAIALGAPPLGCEDPDVVGDDEANKMLTRDYRAPYVVPKIA